MNIRKAKESDADELTRISFASKGYWNYPEHYFKIWKDELTISRDYIRKNAVFVIEEDGVVVGYCSLQNLTADLLIDEMRIEKGVWLEHLFISPEYIGKGFGRRLAEHARDYCASKGWHVLKIMADPNSRGFYKRLGATHMHERPSSIPDRTLPYMEWRTQ